jgi:hypothetical protein
MKNLTYLILLLPSLLFSQINVDNQWKNSINPIFQYLDKSKISSGMLLDYAMEFTDVTAYPASDERGTRERNAQLQILLM